MTHMENINKTTHDTTHTVKPASTGAGSPAPPTQGGAHYTLNKWALADESTEQRHDDPQRK